MDIEQRDCGVQRYFSPAVALYHGRLLFGEKTVPVKPCDFFYLHRVDDDSETGYPRPALYPGREVCDDRHLLGLDPARCRRAFWGFSDAAVHGVDSDGDHRSRKDRRRKRMANFLQDHHPDLTPGDGRTRDLYVRRGVE